MANHYSFSISSKDGQFWVAGEEWDRKPVFTSGPFSTLQQAQHNGRSWVASRGDEIGFLPYLVGKYAVAEEKRPVAAQAPQRQASLLSASIQLVGSLPRTYLGLLRQVRTFLGRRAPG